MSMMPGRGIPQPTNMLAGAPFMQGMPQSGQQQLPPNHMPMQPNTNHANPAMMNAASMTQAQRQQQQHQHQQHSQYMMQQQQMQQQQQQQNDMRRMSMAAQPQGQPGRPIINSMGASGGAVVGGGGQPMAGMGHNPAMFNPAMVAAGGAGPAAVRRVSSQPNMGQGPGGPMGPMPGIAVSVPGMVAQGGVNRPMNPGMVQNAVRITQQSPHANMAGAMAGMNMDRPNAMGTPGAMPGPQGRVPPQPQGIMGSLSQPPSFSQMGNPQSPFPNTPGAQPAQVPSPARTGSHTPNMSMATPGPSHTPVNRQSMGPDDQLFTMGMPNQQFNRPQNHQMPPTVNGNPFPNVGGPSSSPSGPNPDPQSMPPQMMGRGTYPTPAQQFEQMNNNSNSESFGNPQHFSMGPPPIPRPPSQQHHATPHGVGTPQQTHPQMRQSPHPPPDGHMGMHPARPQSQPQNQPAPRPPSRQPQTPRTAHQQPPTAGPSSQGGRPGTAGGSSSGPMPPGMTPGGGPQGPPTMQGPNPGQQMGPRPGPGPQPPQLNPSTQPPNPQQAANPNPAQPGPAAPTQAGLDPNSATNPRSPSFDPTRVLGSGQGLMRLLQFSGALASDDLESTRQKASIKFWDHLMGEYFTTKAQMKITLWKDNQRTEAKPFHITVPVLSRFFLVTTQSGVKSMNLSLDGARERIYNDGHSMVECLGAIWTYKYYNGYSVTLRGPLTVHVVIHIPPPNDPITKQEGFPGYMLKFDDFQFDANFYDKYVLSDVIAGPRTTLPRLESTPLMNGQHMTQQQREHEEDMKWEEPRIGFERAWIPGEPVNSFGIPQATMRCLELAESVSHMEELITFSTKNNLGPLEALQKYAARLKETNGGMFPPLPMMNGAGHSPSGNDFNPMHTIPNPHMISAPITLYSSAPASITNPQSIGTPSSSVTANTASPQNAPPSASSSPQKQHKTIPGGTPSLANATSPAMSSGATNTPAMSNSSLKRKGGDASSPAQGNEPASKRNRKRRGTASGS